MLDGYVRIKRRRFYPNLATSDHRKDSTFKVSNGRFIKRPPHCLQAKIESMAAQDEELLTKLSFYLVQNRF